MGLGSVRLRSSNESRANPDTNGAISKSSSKSTTIVDSTSSDNMDGTTGKRTLMPLDGIDAGGNEERESNVAGVSSAFTTLCADDIDTDCESTSDVFGVSDHVHDGDTGTVKLLDDFLWWDTDGADEQGGLLFDDTKEHSS